MEHLRTDSTPSNRIATLDALRGFALLGVVVVHMVEEYLGALPPPSQPRFALFSPLDAAAQGIDVVLFIGKFFPLFALLFGVTFFIQMERAAQNDVRFERRFVWRLAILFAIGMLHHLLYRGDVLAIYALLGVPLLFVYRASDRVLLGTAALLAIGLPRLLIVAVGHALGSPPSLVPTNTTASEVYFEALKSGSLPHIFLLNIRDGFLDKLIFQFGVFSRGYQTFALYLVGLYVARRGWHRALTERARTLRYVLAWSATTAVAIVAMAVLRVRVAPVPQDAALERVVALTLYDVFNLAVMSALASAFLLLYSRSRPRQALRFLEPVGRMTLTAYVCQSLVGTFVFYGYGLNRLGEMGSAAAMGLAVALFVAQVVVARAWLQRYRYGPLEWLWKSMTYGRIQPSRLERVPTPVALS